ncbi:hypothetical protein B0H14DRAFT_3470636 [Mycena olivaceomarginata]|nr:hypothetical protein B0H14DRAFT_3470636 [Mycena olivaceomarginata]
MPPSTRYIEIHTDIHHFLPPPSMTDNSTTATSASRSELEALVALVARLASISVEGMRLAVEVQARLPLVVAAERSDATALAEAAATAAASAAVAADPLWVRGVPQTPAAIEAQYPEGSGETWYVVIRGREPGFYRTAAEADRVCDGVPNQLKEKKKSRRDAVGLYRSLYNGPDGEGVQKWTEA